jgi:hypothetical protein
MPPRQFNVFSEIVVPYPGETFLWVVNAAEIPSGNSVTVSSSDWPLANPSYTVEPGPGTSATAASTGDPGTFECDPPAPNVSEQTIVLASQAPISICNNVEVLPGDYFIWENTTKKPVLIAPDPGNKNYWPLEGAQHEVPPNGWLSLLVSTEAEDGEYTLVVSTEGAGACPQATQPKIIIETGK